VSGPRIGSLFSGYGGLEMGVRAVLGGETAWVSDIDKGACKVLAHRFPDAPNLGDITTVDWSRVGPVNVLTGGFPCQDLSHAGKRAGMRPDTRSGLWTHMAYAIDQLRPSLVVIENVRGLLSAEAHSDVEPCPWCVGDDADGALRALGAVLGDLADLGYDARWHGLRAADIGAPHGRFRVFVIAHTADSYDARPWYARGERGWRPRVEHGVGPSQPLLPTQLLPTPAVNDMGEGKTVDAWDEWTADMQAKHGNGNGHGKSLAIEAQRLLPTPTTVTRDRTEDEIDQRRATRNNGLNLDDVRPTEWGDYALAITRWEALTRPAPSPTETGPKESPRLSARFAEWLMGLPDGWVTDVPGITRNEALKACGNGVVPQQAAAALRYLLTLEAAA
jgi:DNA (cytosine-5)-methyltransferase 1